ncbi:MAG: PrsW family intramembrane metalloprotease [Propionibacteriaceae bacterium]|nr:PrsW family intramembrane metalloprotease [Propionibacteriaceae bacterium]
MTTDFPPPQRPTQPSPAHYPIHARALRHKQQAVAVPIIFLIVGGLATALGLLVFLERPVAQSLVAVTTFTVVLAAGVWFLHWLDRWEPEPPLFVLGAFLWGAGVSALISGIVNTIVLYTTESETATAMFSAPLIEESTKGLFLVIVLLSTRRGRAEMNSLTDAIVYGGMVGLGFAWIEHISYALMPETMAESTQIIFVRLLLVAYLHPMLTIIVSIGIWAGLNARGAMRLVWPFLGWCLAVALHFLHNGSMELMGTAGLFVAAAIELAVFIGLIIVGIRARGRERDMVARQLPALVHFGWISPLEAGWLHDLGARRRMVAAAGKDRPLLRDFIQNTTELSLLRGRLDSVTRGQPPASWIALHRELAELVSHQRPEVHRILSRGNGWAPMPAQPGHSWGAPPG